MAPTKKKKQPPPSPLDDLPTLLRDLDAGRYTPWQKAQLLMKAEHARLAPVKGRPRKHPNPRELRWRISALTHGVRHEKDGDGVPRAIAGELFKRYKARGLWPDTKTKWAASQRAV